MLDYDDDEPITFSELAATARVVHVRIAWVEYRRTRRGWHVRVGFDRRFKWTPAEMVAFQSVCGSDKWRERLNLLRVRQIRVRRLRGFWPSRWNLLFRRKL